MEKTYSTDPATCGTDLAVSRFSDVKHKSRKVNMIKLQLVVYAAIVYVIAVFVLRLGHTIQGVLGQ